MVKTERENRFHLGVVALFFGGLALIILGRLFMLQVIQHNYFSLLALSTHEIYEKLRPTRGAIYFQDTRNQAEFPAAVNRTYYQVYAVPREIAPGDVASTTARLITLLNITDPSDQALLQKKLSAPGGKYAAIARKIDDAAMDQIKSERIPGIYGTPEEYRYYPEEGLAGNILGFIGADDKGGYSGRYGLEGYWDKDIAGTGGFLSGERGALGSWIDLSKRTMVQPENGSDLLLTIDRTLEFQACQRLKQGMDDYKAKSASLVLLNSQTGAVLAMCSYPDFDPNNFSKTPDPAAFNNTAIFGSYEPGSVFKSVTMAAGLDLGLVTPNTTFTDPCELTINGFHVRNAQQKCYGKATMTNVLENSINTGAVWVQGQIGQQRFEDYVKKFGFGEKTGIELNTESAGDISSLARKGEIFGANGSFGQGITATPLQVAAAYAAIANDGVLLRPHVVAEIRHPDGKREKIGSEVAENVVSPHAAKLLQGMLVSVVENHYHSAQIKGYYIAGKTGTAQIADHGVYSVTRTNQTFAGFGPANNPFLTLVVRYEEPQRVWAEETALPVFHDVMQFALQYYNVPTTR